MTTGSLSTLRPVTEVSVDGDTVVVTGLEVHDPGLAGLLRGHDAAERTALVKRALDVGAKGLLTMGVGLDVGALDARVRQTVDAVATEAEHRLRSLVDEAALRLGGHLDPANRDSHLGRALAEFSAWRDDVFRRLDPAQRGPVSEFLETLGGLLGEGGELDRRLEAALDPEADGSALAVLRTGLGDQIGELRDAVLRQQGHTEGREAEAVRGTAHGLEFEDVVEATVRSQAAAIGGCVVERTAQEPGSLAAASKVGDLVVSAEHGRIVLEVKHGARIALAGGDGILEELDRALANRRADVAICVSGRDAFPAEVGSFAVYGSRILVVDDGEGTLLGVALRYALALLAAGPADASAVDTAALTERLERIRKLGERFSGIRRSLTDVAKSVDKVGATVAEMRSELLELVTDATRELTGARR